MKGFFITFEGMEGSGKSTQVGLLGSRLKEEGFNIVVTREPGGTRIGEEIRNITHSRESVDLTAVTEAYLMAASRAQHIREIIKPALEAGKIVICDRYIDSSLAYQGFGRNLGLLAIEQLNRLAVENIWPDLTFFLSVPLEVGISRRNGTDKIDRLDLQQKDFYLRVKKGYKKLEKKYLNRIITVDGKGSVEEIAEIIWNQVSSRLPRYS